jgi:hypothetical protein
VHHSPEHINNNTKSYFSLFLNKLKRPSMMICGCSILSSLKYWLAILLYQSISYPCHFTFIFDFKNQCFITLPPATSRIQNMIHSHHFIKVTTLNLVLKKYVATAIRIISIFGIHEQFLLTNSQILLVLRIYGMNFNGNKIT